MSLFRSERVVNATLENPVVVGGVKKGPVAIAASGAVNPHLSATYAITKASAPAVLTIADPTIGDAILDRVVHRAHRIELKGPSLRKRHGVSAAAEGDSPVASGG